MNLSEFINQDQDIIAVDIERVWKEKTLILNTIAVQNLI